MLSTCLRSCLRSTSHFSLISPSILTPKFIHTQHFQFLAEVASTGGGQKFDDLPLTGKVSIRADASLHIEPSEMHENSTQHTLTVASGSAEVTHFAELNKFRIHTKDACRILMPCQYDLKIEQNSKFAHISLTSLVNKSIRINAQAPVTINKIKTNSLQVRSEGDVQSTSFLHADTLSVKSEKKVALSHVQGTLMQVEVSNGSVHIDSVYLNECSVEGETVEVHVGSGHGHFTCHIREKGSLRYDSLEGGLEARIKYGHANVHLSRPSSVDIDVAEGDIQLSVDGADSTEGFHSLLDLTTYQKGNIVLAEDLMLDNRELMHMADAVRFTGVLGGTDEPLCRARTREGNIRLSYRSWADQMLNNNCNAARKKGQ